MNGTRYLLPFCRAVDLKLCLQFVLPHTLKNSVFLKELLELSLAFNDSFTVSLVYTSYLKRAQPVHPGQFCSPCLFELMYIALCLNINPGLFFYFQPTAYEKTPVPSKKENIDNFDTSFTSSVGSRLPPVELKGEVEKPPVTSSQGTAAKGTAKSFALPRSKKKP